jgi:hypothetical protein
MCRYLLLFFILLFSIDVYAQPRTDSFLLNLLTSANSQTINKVITTPANYRVQIIYTQINRDKNNKPVFKNYYFNYDADLYFNPASIVKMPLAFLSLEKLNKMHVQGVDKFTPVVFDSSRPFHKPLVNDSTSMNGQASIAHFIKRAFLISENDPYNRMYQFVGQQEINRSLAAKGYKDVRITRQFMGLTPAQNRQTNPVRFIHEDGSTVYLQPAAYNPDSFRVKEIKIGNAHYDKNDSLVNQPFDFTMHNNLSLEAIQQMLQSVLFPQSVPPKQRFLLTNQDRSFLQQYLSQYPSETPYPKYDTSKFYDSYVKFFFRDSTHRMPPQVRVFNKVGWSYGFITDVSYVVDFKNSIEYMLSATVYVNSDGIINDGRYDYASTGYPFLHDVGQAIYRYELARKRVHKPRLTEFKLQYEHRDPNDKRPPLKDVDN